MWKYLFTVIIALGALSAIAANPENAPLDDQLKEVRQEIADKAYPKADAVIRNVLANTKPGKWHYNPFTQFVKSLGFSNDPEFRAQLENWVKTDSKSEFAYLIRAQYLFDTAWEARGYGFTRELPLADSMKFNDYATQAFKDAQKSLSINATIPYTHLLLLRIAKSVANESAQESIFQSSIVRFPGYYSLYKERLMGLEPKWGGTMLKEIALAFRYSATVPKDSALKMLPLDLYISLTENFNLNCKSSGDEAKQEACKKKTLTFLKSDIMHAKLREAFELYNYMDHYEFNEMMIGSLTCDCLARKAASAHLFAVAYDVLGHDNYAINYARGVNHSYDIPSTEAISDYKKALEDAQHFTFPSEEDKTHMLALIYDRLSDTSKYLSDFKTALDYSNSAIALNGKRGSFWFHRCNIYVALANYPSGISDCSMALTLGMDTYWLRYLRGSSYLMLQKYPEAEIDYEKSYSMMADAQQVEKERILDGLNTAYGHNKKYAKVIEIYHQNPEYLNAGDQYTVGRKYAILCHAHMELGEYQQALEDCDRSLAKGNRDIAPVFKQQVLSKMGFGAH